MEDVSIIVAGTSVPHKVLYSAWTLTRPQTKVNITDGSMEDGGACQSEGGGSCGCRIT